MDLIPDTGKEVLDNKIKEWFSLNKNMKLNEEIKHLLKTDSVEELSNLFLKRIEFGTAGLRGKMGPGFSQMNDLVVIQTAQGLLRYLKSLNIHEKGLVVGFDARHNSRRFAELTAGIFVRAGVKVYFINEICPTPFVSFGVKVCKAAAGVMVTASHNPKDDNGYKVYWSNGSQIIPPHDKLISSYIEEDLVPLDEYWDTSNLDNNSLMINPLAEIETLYYAALKENVFLSPQEKMNGPIFTYTPMHGVGYSYIVKAFKATDFLDLVPVPEQIEPDPEFPTVEFPNPEEGKSALQLAIRTADNFETPIILANDPDADRLAVAEKVPGCPWKVFNGNEIGALLAWWCIFTYKQNHADLTEFSNLYVLSSTVSSKIGKTIALQEGCSFEETLTGFKWMGNKTEELLKDPNNRVLLAFEEAIGFMCGSEVPDKDGISAAVNVAELATYLYGNSETLSSKLESIYKQYGYHVSNNSYFYCYDPAVTSSIFKNLRCVNCKEDSYPEFLLNGKYKVIGVRDLTTGYDSNQPDNRAVLPTSKSSQMITFSFDNGFIVTLRTSGTEPKIKYYTELCASPEISDLNQINETLAEMVTALINEFIEPDKYGLKRQKK